MSYHPLSSYIETPYRTLTHGGSRVVKTWRDAECQKNEDEYSLGGRDVGTQPGVETGYIIYYPLGKYGTELI